MTDEAVVDSAPDTLAHIARVGDFMAAAVSVLVRRASRHDASKLMEPEKEAFDIATPKLAGLAYGSDEYRESLRALGPALKHHQMSNDHHPEFHGGDVANMSLLSLLEMLCDWRAASERMLPPEGETYGERFARSIALNQERWGYSDDVASILSNTARELGMFS